MKTRDELTNYLENCNLGTGFRELEEYVINKNNCILCGACVSLCPRIQMEDSTPVLLEYDSECSMCFRYCARTFFPTIDIKNRIFTGNEKKDLSLGMYRSSVSAKCNSEEILEKSQNGGIATTLLIHALECNYIDGALLIDRDENWKPIPVVARTPEEIMECAGTKYAISPSLITYEQAVNKYNLKKLAFVGMPCQILAVRKLQMFPPLSDVYGRFRLIIGLFCSSNFSYDSLKEFVESKFHISISDVKKFDISKGKFIIYLKDDSIHKIDIKELKSLRWSSCINCKDYTAEFADISLGNVGSDDDNFTSVLIRTEPGESLFNDAIAKQKIIVSENIGLSKIKKLSNNKKTRISKLNNLSLESMKAFGLTEKELRVYVSLIMLGNANYSKLEDITKSADDNLKVLLKKLTDRRWIQKTNGNYSPVNPHKVFRNEISLLRKKLESQIKKIESETLKELEELYIKNNFTSFNEKDFLD
ncbi:MAG: hypothetical protein GF383_13245 [Candidatus Lokiarchaeota archaeon]|nr:hypothetical protein [Candidatus Lokiarchaeota archaeon]MBD3342130.1 hypothetical protein [Candidatus Lokiarchaeota archaeon]